MADLPNAHDALFRAAFEDPSLAAAFLRDHLPNRIAALLDVTRPEKIDGSFVDEALSGSQSDALYKVRTRFGTPVYCYLLIEHKSTPDTGLPLQLAHYMIRIWRRHVNEHGVSIRQKLPPIVPLVLYAGERRWTVPDGLGEMITGPAELAFLPGASYILRNIGEIPVAALSRNAMLRSVLITMRREAMDHLADVVKSLPKGSDLRKQVFKYINETYKDVGLEDIMAELRRLGAYDMEAYMGTIAQTMHAEGKAEGLAEGLAAGLAEGKAEGLAEGLAEGKAEGLATGLAEGKAEGLAEGKAATLLRQLQRRFGPVPRSMRDRVAASDVAQIDTWLDAVLDAPSLSAVFDPNAPH